MTEQSGTLFVCATPIGNLEDVSIRLLKTLRKVDVIACEDTRHTIKLLNRYKIRKPLTSYHQHSSKNKEDALLEELQNGKQVALVSDAGMPAISDPGAELVRRAIEAGIPVQVIPGPSALVTALAWSGLDTQSFIFTGFLPVKSGQRRDLLGSLVNETRTVILYEAPHRLLRTLAELEEILGGQRRIAVARELTKTFEEVRRGTIAEVLQHFTLHEPRGEFTVVIAGASPEARTADMDQIAREVRELVESGMEKKEALKVKAREYSLSKSVLYNYYVTNEDKEY